MAFRNFSILLFVLFCVNVKAQTIENQSENSIFDSPVALFDNNQVSKITDEIVSADSVPEVQPKTTMDKMNNIKNGIEWYMKYFPVPYASYSSETNFLFGVSKYNAFVLNRRDKADSITQPSSVNAFGYFTLNKQQKIALESNLMFKNNKALWTMNLYLTNYPLQFYGVGNDTKTEDKRTLITSDWQISSSYLFKTWRKWYLGPSFDFYDYYRVELDEGDPGMPSDSINLIHNMGNQSALGLKLQMEGRDNRLNAKSGMYIDAGYHIFRKEFGSEYKYNYFHGDVRYYLTPFRTITFVTQLKTESKQGDVPVQSLAFLGGDYSMRGTYIGRYRDKVSLVTELEMRFPIYWIFGGVLFNSIGQVAPSYSDLAFKNFHYNYGLGLRVKVDTKNNVNLRFDYGVSSDQHFFIINFAESF